MISDELVKIAEQKIAICEKTTPGGFNQIIFECWQIQKIIDEIKRLRSENSELRARLAVFEEGLPRKDYFLYTINMECALPVVKSWLEKIASTLKGKEWGEM